MTTSGVARLLCLCMLAVVSFPALASVDTYRYFHVTIDTVWLIFVFLLIIVLAPFILMAVLYWWTLSNRRAGEQEGKE
jgi:uncharacterized BrkB/YihY/UPF0761 family membrane protein